MGTRVFFAGANRRRQFLPLQTELLNRAENDPGIDCVLLPFPKGDLICRKCRSEWLHAHPGAFDRAS